MYYRYPKEWVIPLGIAFSVYGWGHNHRGQLGGVEGNKIKTPRLCEAFSELSPVKVIGGEQTMFATTKEGKVRQWGLSLHTYTHTCKLNSSHHHLKKEGRERERENMEGF